MLTYLMNIEHINLQYPAQEACMCNMSIIMHDDHRSSIRIERYEDKTARVAIVLTRTKISYTTVASGVPLAVLFSLFSTLSTMPPVL